MFKIKKFKNLPEVAKPFDELRSVVLVELDIREVNLQNGGAGISHIKEHQLRLPQVHRSQCTGVCMLRS